MKKYYLFLLIIISHLSFCQENDFLEPETGYFSGYKFQDEYYILIKKCLFKDLDYNTEGRVIVMPSFSPEILISVDKIDGKYELFYRKMNKEIWTQYNKSNKIDSTFTEKRISINEDFANKIHQLFLIAILNSKYPKVGLSGLDGTTYVFLTFENNYGNISAQTWTPATNKLSKLVFIVNQLYNLIEQNDKSIENDIKNNIENLINDFKIDTTNNTG